MNLEPIKKSRRRDERTLCLQYKKDRPFILGSLLDAACTAIRRLPETRLDEAPRMADFARWIVAAEQALWPAGTFIAAYGKAQADAVVAGLEASPVAQAVTELMEIRQEWTGTATELLAAIETEDRRRHPAWPKTPQGLSNKLRRVAPALRKIGINIAFIRESAGRFIKIEKVCETLTQASQVSQALKNKAFSVTIRDDHDAPVTLNDDSASWENVNNINGHDDRDARDANLHVPSSNEERPWAVTI